LKLEELGVPVATVLRRAGLPADLFLPTRVLVTTEEMFALWTAIGEVATAAIKDPAVGLKLATETKTERFHPSGLAALSTDNFGSAIELMARYKVLTCPEEIHHGKADGEWRIQFRWLLAVGIEPYALVEYCFAWVHSIAQHGSGTKLCPLRIELVQPRAHVKQLERHFGCPVMTGMASNAMIFRAEDADCPFITRNAELLDMLAPQFDQELKARRNQGTFAEMVRDAIQQRLTGHRPSIDDIARDLHVSSRTLQRKLQDAGSSYQRVLDEARHEMARYYLGNSVLELNEAAYLLGYEDSNSFVRAFRSWEGIPPGQWRSERRV
jgi:AraC-like DNA-binding protein